VEDWLLPHLTAIHENVMAQMNGVANQCNQHDARIHMDLKEELAELERQFKIKTEKARQYNEAVPDEKDLEADKATATRRAETKKAVRFDPIGVREFIGKLKPFLSLLQERRNDIIDALNAGLISQEVSTLKQLTNDAVTYIREGRQLDAENKESISMADLGARIRDLNELISRAISAVHVVSYRKGVNAGIEDVSVEHGRARLIEIFTNIQILMQYRQAHREIMSLRFTVLHPLTHSPCSLDSLVRLGYATKQTNAMPALNSKNPQNRHGNKSQGNNRNHNSNKRMNKNNQNSAPAQYD